MSPSTFLFHYLSNFLNISIFPPLIFKKIVCLSLFSKFLYFIYLSLSLSFPVSQSVARPIGLLFLSPLPIDWLKVKSWLVRASLHAITGFWGATKPNPRLWSGFFSVLCGLTESSGPHFLTNKCYCLGQISLLYGIFFILYEGLLKSGIAWHTTTTEDNSLKQLTVGVAL